MDNELIEDELPEIRSVVFEEEEEEKDEDYYLNLNANRVLVHFAQQDKAMHEQEVKEQPKKRSIFGAIGNFIYHHKTAVIIVSIIAAVAVLWFATL